MDESIIENTGKEDIDLNKFNHYFQAVYKKDFDEIDHSLDTLLEKLHLARKGKLNLAGLLLFGRHPSLFRPAFIIKAVSFFGDSSMERVYRDSEDIEGDLKTQFKDVLVPGKVLYSLYLNGIPLALRRHSG
jgi:ATP-dependent DNA helicase RecG